MLLLSLAAQNHLDQVVCVTREVKLPEQYLQTGMLSEAHQPCCLIVSQHHSYLLPPAHNSRNAQTSHYLSGCVEPLVPARGCVTLSCYHTFTNIRANSFTRTSLCHISTPAGHGVGAVCKRHTKTVA